MALMGALREQLNHEKQQTENGAIGYRTSGRHLLDLNFAVGSMRNWGDERILREYKKAYYEQPLLAVKWLFLSAGYQRYWYGRKTCLPNLYALADGRSF